MRYFFKKYPGYNVYTLEYPAPLGILMYRQVDNQQSSKVHASGGD